MAKRHIKLVFPQELIREPVVFTMAKKFDVVPNIRRARVTETVGEMTLELEGSEDVLNQAVKYLESRGVRVESAMGDSVI
jgi:ABC-type methionine transport system ATPase subunit